MVTHFKHSTIASDALRKERDSRGGSRASLKQSVVTRWNSTYDMLDVIRCQQVAILAVLHDKDVTKPADCRSLQLKDEEWDLMEPLCDVLKPLAATTTWLSAEENTSVSIIAVAILQIIKVHLAHQDIDLPVITQFKKLVTNIHVCTEVYMYMYCTMYIVHKPYACTFKY